MQCGQIDAGGLHGGALPAVGQNQAIDNRFVVVLKPDQLDVGAALAALGAQRAAKFEASMVGKHKSGVNSRVPARLPVKAYIQIEKIRPRLDKIRKSPV